MCPDRLISVNELAVMLGLSRHTVYAWSASGRLPAVKLGTRTMFEPAEIRRWLSEQARPASRAAGEENGLTAEVVRE